MADLDGDSARPGSRSAEQQRATAPAQNNTQASNGPPAGPPKKGLLARLGIEPPIILMCLKGAVAPTVALAMCQADSVAGYFVTVGYIIGIVTILSMPIMPRGKFIQGLVLNLLGVSIGAAMGILALWSAYKAREHTQSQPSGYNSSQSAVAAIWLFFNIWLSNFMRAKNPSLTLPVIVYTIMVNISATYSPLMHSYPQLATFIKQLYTAFLTSFALGTVTSLFFIPTSSRMVASAQMKGLIMLLRGIVKQEKVYLHSLEKEDMFAVPAFVSCGTGLEEGRRKPRKSKKDRQADKKDRTRPNGQAEAEAVKLTIFKCRELMGKIQADLPFAEREFAWGKLESKQFKHIFGLLREIAVATSGIGTIIDIFQRIANDRGWVTDENTDLDLLAEKVEEKRVWNQVMKQLHEPFQVLSEAIDQGLEHAGMALEILPKPKKAALSKNKGDVEAKGGLVSPGDPGFANVLRTKIETFHTVRKEILQAWARENGLAHDNFDDIDILAEEHNDERRQLFVLLYIESLMQAAGVAVLRLVEYADNKVEDGSMSKSRLILPSGKKLKRWVTSIVANNDRSREQNTDLFDGGLTIVHTSKSISRKDPEHLPAVTTWERFGNAVRIISRLISSPESGFGLRVACATLTIGIVAFLEDSYTFFQQQRLVWAMIMVAFSMTETSGQSIYGFLCRIIGTLVAMVLSIVNWYIVNEKTAGVIVFLYIFLAIEFFFFFKYPQFFGATIICIVTHILIIGYELQTQKIGIARAERSGQPYYPIYELAPYRLATVAGGCFVAFIWTIFPSPVTDRTWLRKDLAATLYLLAEYFGVIKEKVHVTLDGIEGVGSAKVKGTHMHTLTKNQRDLCGKLMLLLPSLRQHAEFQRWEPTIGGAFPRELYEDIITRAMRINSYLTLIEHTVDTPPRESGEGQLSSNWLHTMRKVFSESTTTQDNIICTFVLLSNALESGHSLPPNLPLPRANSVTMWLEDMRDSEGRQKGLELLDARHMTESGFAEFAVLQVCATLICDDLAALAKDVCDLVGTVDFSFVMDRSESTLASGGDNNNAIFAGAYNSDTGDGSSTLAEGAGAERGRTRRTASGLQRAEEAGAKQGKND